MPEYIVQGSTYAGHQVDTIIEANSQRDVLIAIIERYNSRLKKGFVLYTQSEASADELKTLVKRKKYLRNWSMEDEDVIRVAAAIRENDPVTELDRRALERYCKSLTDNILERLWNDVPDVPKTDKAWELFQDIVMEFLPKYEPYIHPPLRVFLWKKVNYRVVRDWRRKKYVNADRKDTSEAKVVILADHFRRIAPDIQIAEQLTDKERIIQSSIQVASHLDQLKKQSPTMRREFFEEVLRVGLLDEIKLTVRQRTVLRTIYGQRLKETAVAEELGIKQPTVNKVKNTAERAFFRSVKKKFGKSE
jgi:hypothetical protein